MAFLFKILTAEQVDNLTEDQILQLVESINFDIYDYSYNEDENIEMLCSKLVKYGHLRVLKILQNKGYFFSNDTVAETAANAKLDILEWMDENNFDWTSTNNSEIMRKAVESGNIDTIKWLYDKKCYGRDKLVKFAIESGNLETLKFVICTLNYELTSDAFRSLKRYVNV